MATDDIQPTNTAVGANVDSSVLQSSIPVSADTLERWTRAVTAPRRPMEQEVKSPDVLPNSSQPAPTQEEGLGLTARDAGGRTPSGAFHLGAGLSAQELFNQKNLTKRA